MYQLLMRLFSFSFVFFGAEKAFSLQFYDETVSYFDESKKINRAEKAWNFFSGDGIKNEKYSIRELDNQPFNWNNYLDPSNIQFWDSGGDFVPSLPWRQVAVNPSDDNIKKYIEWQNKKLKLSSQLQEKMASYSPQKNKSKEENITPDISHNIKWNEIEIAYFYQTSCHYCQRSSSIIEYLKKQGAKIIPIQLDWEKNPPMYHNSIKYDDKLEKQFKIETTPVWIIKSKKGGSKKINGYVSLEQLSEQISIL